METAGQSLEDEEQRDALKDKGLYVTTDIFYVVLRHVFTFQVFFSHSHVVIVARQRRGQG